MRVELLNLGWMTAPAGLWRQGDSEPEQPLRLPVPAYLIETETERILVDTGLHPDAVTDPSGHYGENSSIGFFGLEQEQSLVERVDLGTLTKVVLTHLHFDHAGGLLLIPGSVPVVVQRAEWEAGQNRSGIEQNFFLARDYAETPPNLVLVDGDHDLLGDGSVVLLSTPGHTVGHQSVRVGDLVIGGDVALFASGFDDHRFPAFGYSQDQQVESAERLRQLRDAGLKVQPGHDPDLLRPGPLAI
ncbi:MAG TPA: N-acyl homoserine lactonase family protein [Solirubrobacterales bacterium]|nr:N-acyl homoserine lactonase family protein [Solirubrobacterales bacterium]